MPTGSCLLLGAQMFGSFCTLQPSIIHDPLMIQGYGYGNVLYGIMLFRLRLPNALWTGLDLIL